MGGERQVQEGGSILGPHAISAAANGGQWRVQRFLPRTQKTHNPSPWQGRPSCHKEPRVDGAGWAYAPLQGTEDVSRYVSKARHS